MSHAVVLDLLAQLQDWDDAADPQPLVAILADALGDLGHPKQIDVRDLRIVEAGQSRELWIGAWNHFAHAPSEREARARLRAYLFGMLTVPCPECHPAPRPETPGIVASVRQFLSGYWRSIPPAGAACSECQGRGYKLRPTDDF
jgi:hypothetical protein